MKSRCLAAIVAVLFAALAVAGCGAESTTTQTVSGAQTTIPPFRGKPPVQSVCVPSDPLAGSACTPEGAKPQGPPSKFSLGGRQVHLSHHGAVFIEGFEGFSSCPYWDSYGGVATRGYGETEGIHMSSPCISRAYGEHNLIYRAERFYGWAIRRLGVSFNRNQADALFSFLWNLGAGIAPPGSSLARALQHHNPYPLLAYVHAGGQVLAGLVTRRRAEVRLFLTPVRDRAAEHRHLLALYAGRAHIRKHLVHAGCRVKHPRKACGPLFHRGGAVNLGIRRLHARGIY